MSAAFAALERDNKAREKRLHTAARKAARATRNFIVREKVPRAFGELADSAHIVEFERTVQIVFDAPHAGAVEVGSRPHVPPLEPLIAWVTLRGIQGLTASGGVRSNRTKRGDSRTPNNRLAVADWRRESSRVVAGALREKLGGNKQAATWRAHYQNALRSLTPSTLGQLDADPAVRSVAFAIQQKIARQGTRPYRYVGTSLDEAVSQLHGFVQAALPDRA